MTSKIAAIPQSDYSSDFFSLIIDHKKHKTNIVMKLFDERLNTRYFPLTISILDKTLPKIFLSECYNKEGYSFRREARKTEIGHLFEHILLAYLCKNKLLTGNPARYSGITRWNWVNHAHGVFHISIDMDIEDEEVFKIALAQSISLLEKIISTHKLPN